jgi:hypothetical protein
MMRAVLVAAAALGLATAGCASTVDKNIKSMGYSPVRPPQKIVGPGTIVLVRSTNPLTVQVVCAADEAYGSAPRIDTSPSATLEWRRRTKGTFNLEAQYKERINAEVEGAFVREVRMTLANSKVLNMPLGEVTRAVQNGTVSTSCVSTVRALRGAGGAVSVVAEVLEADVNFTLDYDASVKPELRMELTREIAPRLVADVQSTGTNTINGTGLWWGLRDAPEMIDVYLGQVLVAASDEKRDRISRLIPADHVKVLPGRAVP